MRRAALISLLILPLVTPLLAAQDRFVVVVNESVQGTQMHRNTLSAIFLRQAPNWSDGTAVVPVDQSTRNPVRSWFASDVLGQPLAAVQIYWQRRMSSGVTPPPVKASDEEVLEYVANNPGAIGYVAESTVLPAGVKTIKIIE